MRTHRPRRGFDRGGPGSRGATTLRSLVTDLGLPDGSGLDLMREIKRRYGWRGIAVSGYGMAADQQQTTLAGFAAHLVKPVDMNRLRRTISEVMAAAPALQPTSEELAARSDGD